MWKQDVESLSKKTTLLIDRYGRENIMVWGCIGWDGVGKIADT